MEEERIPDFLPERSEIRQTVLEILYSRQRYNQEHITTLITLTKAMMSATEYNEILAMKMTVAAFMFQLVNGMLNE